MKSLIVSIGSAVVATALCVTGCTLFGMPREELRIVVSVAGGVSLATAIIVPLLAKFGHRPQ